ncbi:MAG: hypothetical protein IJ263_10505 [Paludibacteraceae bacterium]|nr:hypothetical protein [Paludibacteraceae bacterium]
MRRILKYLVLSAVLYVFVSCEKQVLTEEEAQRAVIDGERDHLPLILQKMSDVESITIDSLRIHVKDEPMSGFLYTTWEYTPTSFLALNRGKKRIKNIIVSVDSIRQSKTHEGYIEWQSNWKDAYEVVLKDMLR